MNFWTTLIEELRRIGFSTIQINKLRDQFGTLDAAKLLNTPELEFLPHMTGRSRREKQEKIAALLAVVEEVQVRMDRQSRRGEIVTINGELKGLPKDVLWQGLTVGLVDLKRSPRQTLWRTAVEDHGKFSFQVSKRDWQRLFPTNEPRFRFMLFWNGRPLYSTREPIAFAADPNALPIDIDVPPVAVSRLQAMASPQKLRRELDVDAIAKAANVPAAVQTQLRQANIQAFDDLFSTVGRTALQNLDLDRAQTRQLYTTARWAAYSGDVDLVSRIVGAGIDSSDRLARTPAQEIEERLDLDLTPEEREGLNGLILFAQAESNLLQDVNSEKPNGWLDRFKVPDSIIAPDQDDDDGTADHLCADCDSCATVFSPLAYAYDLVTFIEDTWGVDPQAIEDLILQDIDLDCARAQEPVQQIVLAIEVLERYLQEERQVPISSINEWPVRYRAFANAVLRALSLDPALGTVRRHQRALYTAARETTPTTETVRLLVDLARDYFESYVAPERVSDPEEPTSNDDDAYAAYLAQLTQVETQRQQLQYSFAQHLESLIAPVLIDYRTLLITAAAREASDLEQLLFIDLQTAACMQTTRIVQIIQSLHSLVLSIRTRTIVKNARTVVAGAGFDPDRFDEVSWHWLQTYASWNAAMYVLVYPENLLSPPVHQHRMTGFYRDVASELMAGSASAETIVEVEQRFASYFRVLETLQPFAASVIGKAANERLVIFARAMSGSDYSLWMNTIETSHFPWGGTPAVEQINADGWTQVQGWRDDLRPVMALPYGEMGTERFIVLGSGRAARWTTYRIGTEGELIGESALQNLQDAHEVILSTGASLANHTPVVWSSHGDQWYTSEFDVSVGEWPAREQSIPPWFNTIRFNRTIPTPQGGTTEFVQLATTRVGAAHAAVKRDSTKANGAGIVLSYNGYYGDQPYVPKNLRRFSSDQDYGNYIPILAWSRTRSSFIVFRSSEDGHIYVSRVQMNTDSTTNSVVRRVTERIDHYADHANWPPGLTAENANDMRLLERYLHFPLLAGWALNLAGDYISAHNWYRRLYDPYADPVQSFPFDTMFQGAFQRLDDWLYGVDDPDAIARRRGDVYLRHTILMMTKNLLDWADHEFSLNSVESRNRARDLYRLAAIVLQAPAMDNPCAEQLQALEFKIVQRLVNKPANTRNASAGAFRTNLTRQAIKKIQPLQDGQTVLLAVEKLGNLLDQELTLREFDRELNEAVQAAVSADQNQQVERPSLMARLQMGREQRERLEQRLNPGWSKTALPRRSVRPASPQIGRVTDVFCTPQNPLLQSYRNRIEFGLTLLRSCLDVNGEPVPTGFTGSLQGRSLTTFGQLIFQATAATEPPRYRYDFLIDKARQHAALAQQLESSMLAAIEKRDNAALALLQAEIAEEVANATITLRSMTKEEAQQGVQIAALQTNRANTELEFWKERVGDGSSFMGVGGLNAAETTGLALMGTSGVLQGLAAVGYMALVYPAASAAYTGALVSAAGAAGGTATSATGVGAAAGATATGLGGVAMMAGIAAGGSTFLSGVQAAAGAAGTFGSLALTWASFERRWEEWRHQHELATIGKQLGDAQLLQAQSRVAIAQREMEIAELQRDHSLLVLDFHRNRFSNEQLYQWMIGVLQDAYRSVMQNATATAKLAQRALEFERQQPITVVQGDYWSIDAATLTEEQRASGLLGAERLLSDMSRLDEWKLRTDRRRLELSKTISLAQMAPSDFMRFRETGVMNFNTLMDWFDWDFPGHYLRLIKSVRVSMIALVPPIDGIHATLANSGHSRIVVPQDGTFVEVDALRRFPEAVALDSPTNDSGLFVLDYKDPMLLPFEGLGVETGWRLELPKASNRLNFDSLVDVYFTIEYTAFQDTAYRDQVIARLGSRRNSDLIISLRSNYPDQWYDLHNPEDETAGQTLTIDLPPYTFPAAASDELGIRQVMVLLLGPSGKARSGAFKLQRVGYAPSFTVNTDENGAFSTRNGVKVDGDDIPHSPFAIDPNNSTNLLPAPASGDIALLDPRGEWQMTFGPEWYDVAGSAQAIDGLHDIILIPTVEYEANWPS